MPSGRELRDEQEASEENTDDSEEEDEGRVEGGAAAKRGRASGPRKKRVKLAAGRDTAKAAPAEEQPAEPAKVGANIDDLWSEFKRDVQTVAQPKRADPALAAVDSEQPRASDEEGAPPTTKTVTEIFEFAGEAVEVRKEVPADAPAPAPAPVLKPRGRGGLSSVLGQIGKKNKLSVLEKTKLDWDTFKQAEGIQEQLRTHNRGKEGFLEKQDFLQRADLRQFELEKAMRSASRRPK